MSPHTRKKTELYNNWKYLLMLVSILEKLKRYLGLKKYRWPTTDSRNPVVFFLLIPGRVCSSPIPLHLSMSQLFTTCSPTAFNDSHNASFSEYYPQLYTCSSSILCSCTYHIFLQHNFLTLKTYFVSITGWLGRSTAVSGQRIPGPLVCRWHCQLGSGMRHTQPSGRVRQRPEVFEMDRRCHKFRRV